MLGLLHISASLMVVQRCLPFSHHGWNERQESGTVREEKLVGQIPVMGSYTALAADRNICLLDNNGAASVSSFVIT